MALAYYQPELPPLQVAVEEAGLAIGDILMFASISPEQRANPDLAELNAVLGPYIEIGELVVRTVQKPSLALVSTSINNS